MERWCKVSEGDVGGGGRGNVCGKIVGGWWERRYGEVGEECGEWVG